MAQRLLPANSRLLTVPAVLLGLGACAGAPPEAPAAAPAAGWHVVERVGEARYAPPDAVGWLAVISGRPIAEGSHVTTGPGGRLILAASGRHISAGPDSRFQLPRPRSNDHLEQRAGWLRYRIAGPSPAPFRVRTRSLDLEFATAVIDVRVEDGSTEVTVKEGEVRLATPDGLRRTEIAAGQSARAGDLGTLLAVRRAPAEELEAVAPAIVAAVAPAVSAQSPAPPPAAPKASNDASAPIPLPRPSSPAAASEPITAAPSAAVSVAQTGRPAAVALDDLPTTLDRPPTSGRRAQLERLTAGMVDGVPAAPPRSPLR